MNFITKLLNLGIYPELSFQEKNKLKVFNTACTLVLAICTFYFIYGLVFRFHYAVVVSCFFMSCLITSFFLVSRRKYSLAFHIGMISGFIFLTAFTYLFGAGSKSYFYFLFMPVASTILFDSIKITVKYMVISLVWLVLNVAFTEYMVPFYHDVDVYYGNQWLFGYPNMVFTVLLIFLGLRVFKLENRKYATLIEDQKQKLEEIEQRVDRQH